MDSVVAVTASWAGPGGGLLSNGGRVTVSGVTGSGPYQSTLTLSSLVTSDTGDYTCTASVGTSTPQVVASGDGTDTHTIAVGKRNGYPLLDIYNKFTHVYCYCMNIPFHIPP